LQAEVLIVKIRSARAWIRIALLAIIGAGLTLSHWAAYAAGRQDQERDIIAQQRADMKIALEKMSTVLSDTERFLEGLPKLQPEKEK
jgi:hypothetical protein